MAEQVTYRERLTVPITWWALAALLVASAWLAYAVAVRPLVAALVAAGLGVAAAALLAGYGSARVEVGPQGLRAARALLPWWACGTVTALSAEELRRCAGPAADARAYLLLRPYLGRGVRVEVRDDADPTPYWLVGSRHPERLAAAASAAAAQGPPE